MASSFRIISWNIAELRDDVWSYLKPLLLNEKPAIMFLCETKCKAHRMERYFSEVKSDYIWILNAHTPSNTHGVAMLIRKDVKYHTLNLLDDAETKFECPARSDTLHKYASCGRMIAIKVTLELKESKESKDTKDCKEEKPHQFMLVATYSPNAGQGLKHLDYRVNQWDKHLFEFLNKLRDKHPTIWMGDINVAPFEIDASDPSYMKHLPGHTEKERASLAEFVKSKKFIDIWRHQHATEIGYTWRGKNPEKWNGKYGLRLDTCYVSAQFVEQISKSEILPCTAPTDHVPIAIELR